MDAVSTLGVSDAGSIDDGEARWVGVVAQPRTSYPGRFVRVARPGISNSEGRVVLVDEAVVCCTHARLPAEEPSLQTLIGKDKQIQVKSCICKNQEQKVQSSTIYAWCLEKKETILINLDNCIIIWIRVDPSPD